MTKNKETCDVCIIGSGSGGAVVAKELAEQGMSIVVLEAGKRFDPLRNYISSAKPDWEISSWQHAKQFRVEALHKVTFENEFTHRPAEVHGVGGGTIRYLAYAIRMLPDDFRIYTVDGVGKDWPISYEDLVPYYRKVELDLGVSGLSGDPWTPLVDPYPNPPFKFSYANKIIKRGCDKLGIKLWPTPMARLSKPFDGRPHCIQCGRCSAGCMTKAKSSMDVTYITKAEATNNVSIQSEAIATRIRVDKSGKPTGVIYYDNNGVEHEQKAKIIVVSAGAVQSPRLLLNSHSNQYPNGLANSSGLIGKYFMQHTGLSASGIFEDRIDSFRGFFGGATSQDYAKTLPNSTFARGWIHELHAGIKGPVQTAQAIDGWGANLKKQMKYFFGHIAGVATVGEQLPYEKNSITLDPKIKDDYGMPVPRINFQFFENDRLMAKAMEKNIHDILDAAGAVRIINSTIKPGAAPHNMGTCRMGNNPTSSVLNSFCQAHDVPNLFVIDSSCFVTSGTANPSLTIHAIAARASEYIIKEATALNL